MQVAYSFRKMLTLILWCPKGQAHIRQVASYITEIPDRSGHIESTPASHAGLLQSELRPGDRLSYFFFFVAFFRLSKDWGCTLSQATAAFLHVSTSLLTNHVIIRGYVV